MAGAPPGRRALNCILVSRMMAARSTAELAQLLGGASHRLDAIAAACALLRLAKLLDAQAGAAAGAWGPSSSWHGGQQGEEQEQQAQEGREQQEQQEGAGGWEQELLQQVLALASQHLASFGPRQAANSAYALARLAGSRAAARLCSSPEQRARLRDMQARAQQRALQQLPQMKAQEVSNVLWALGSQGSRVGAAGLAAASAAPRCSTRCARRCQVHLAPASDLLLPRVAAGGRRRAGAAAAARGGAAGVLQGAGAGQRAVGPGAGERRGLVPSCTAHPHCCSRSRLRALRASAALR
jgi:hypothetical protein